MSADVLPPLAIGAPEAALMLGIGTRLLWSLTASGAIPSVRIGRRVVYRVEALREFLRKQEAK